AAVVGRRNLGVALDRLAPDAVGGADDADADRRRLVHTLDQRAADGDGGLADLEVARLDRLRHDELARRLDLEQGQHARLVGGDDLGDVALLVVGHGDDDRAGLVGEVERAGDDVAVLADDHAAGRADALADLGALGAGGDDLGAAARLDHDDARGDPLDGVLVRRLFLLAWA